MSRYRSIFIVLLSTSLVACLDFVDPVVVEPDPPEGAFFQVDVRVNESGIGVIHGHLVPGRAFGGLVRAVPNDSVTVNGMRIGPLDVGEQGYRTYGREGALSPTPLDTNTPLEIRAPIIEGLVGLPPDVRWYTIRKLDPDTVHWTRGTDLVLNVDTSMTPSEPVPQIRQWHFAIGGTDRWLELSSVGLPPSDLRIPSGFVPTPLNNQLMVSLSYYQAAAMQSAAKDYHASYSFVVTLTWIVKVSP